MDDLRDVFMDVDLLDMWIVLLAGILRPDLWIVVKAFVLACFWIFVPWQDWMLWLWLSSYCVVLPCTARVRGAGWAGSIALLLCSLLLR